MKERSRGRPLFSEPLSLRIEEFDECAEEEFQSSAVISFLLISLPFSNYQQKEVSQKRRTKDN